MLWGDWRVCTFESPRSSLNKISCTRQFESKLSLRSFAKSLDKRIFSKITPSLFTLKEGSTSHPDPLSSGAREKTALLGARNRYALRLADHQRSSPYCAGWDRLGHNDTMCISLMLIYTSLRKTKTSNKYIVISSLTLLQIPRNLQRS